MASQDTSAARHYHEITKHPEDLFETLASPAPNAPRRMDPAIKPMLHKVYTGLEPIPLRVDLPPSELSALAAIGSAGPDDSTRQVPDLAMLARLLFFSDGITKHIRRGDRTLPFRAAPCTGALYHVELYLVCGDVPDLAAGVYHYGVHDNGLRQLRAGDFRQVLIEATGAEPAVAQAPVIMVCTSTFWRNSWKYGPRAYRHTFWDTGTMLPNTFAVAAALGVPHTLVLGFADDPVNRLLGVDPDREAAVALVALGRTADEAPVAPPVEPLDLPTEPLSAREIDEPEIRAMRAASSLPSGEAAAAWRQILPAQSLPVPTGSLTPLRPQAPSGLPTTPIETVILRRGSTRQFSREAVDQSTLTTLLRLATTGVPADCFPPTGVPLSDVYLIVNAVNGLEPGSYVLHQDTPALELLTPGEFRDEAGHLALDQDLAGDAAVNIYFLTDLEPILAQFGNRGYWVGQLGAALAAGKLYLASYALGPGATGLTFYDDAVTSFFSPHAAGKSVMFLMALGQPAGRSG